MNHRVLINTKMKYLLSYLLIFLLACASFALAFQMNTQILRKNLYKQNTSALTRSEQLISNRLSEVLNMLNLIANNPDMRSALAKENPVRHDYVGNALDLVYLRTLISNFMMTNSFVDQILLYNETDQFCVSPRNIYLRLDDSRNQFVTDVLIYELRDMTSYFNQQNMFQVFQDEEASTYLMITQEFPSRHKKLHALLFINTEKLTTYFTRNAQLGNFYIYDGWGNPLFTVEEFGRGELSPLSLSQNESFQLAGEEYTVARVDSSFKNYTYLSILPSEEVLNDMYLSERITFIALLVSFILALFASFLLSRLNYRPIQRLLSSINFGPEATYSTDEFTLIQEHFRGILQKSQQSQEKISEYIRKSFFSELINGQFQSDAEIAKFADSFQITLPREGSEYLVLLGKFHIYADADMKRKLDTLYQFKKLLSELIVRYLPETLAVVDTNYNHFVIILDRSQTAGRDVEAAALALTAEAQAISNLFVSFAVSDQVRSLSDISNAYSHAISAMDHASVFESPSLIRYTNSREYYSNQLYFPPSLQIRLTNAVTSSKVEEVRSIVSELLHKNIEELHLSTTSLRLLYYSLCTCMVDLSNHLAQIPDDLIATIRYCLNVSDDYVENFSGLSNCFIQLAVVFSEQKDSLQASINHSVLQFVDEHLNSHELCLTMVADEFQFSEPYISTLIKELTGMSFITYITTKRIERALELLNEKRFTINTVADMVGYNSTNSFRKAFKKITGQNPSSYKDSGAS